MAIDADVIVVGGGIAGLVTAAEACDAGAKVLVLDQEPEQSLGGQAFWSLGGLLFVDSPEQRRLRIHDSFELAWMDWLGTAGFDRGTQPGDEDYWPRQWAEAYVNFAAGEKRAWLYEQGLKVFPTVGWAERGGGLASGHGNSVPRFHITVGAGPGTMAPFERRCREHEAAGNLEFRFRHRVDDLVLTDGRATGVTGTVLAPSDVERGQQSNRDEVGEFELSAQAIAITSGGIGGNFDLVRKNWPTERIGPAPEHLISGVPHHVDGRMLEITEGAGGNVVNRDRMWHYTEGIRNWDPIWPHHAIRVLPGPSSLWLSATGDRLPIPAIPGSDSLGTMKAILDTGYDYSWFILTQKIIEKEFALSGSEQNPDLTNSTSPLGLLKRLGSGPTEPVQKFMDHGPDFVVEDNLEALVRGMNELTDEPLLDFEKVKWEVQARDMQLRNPFTKDLQVMQISNHRNALIEKLVRTAPPHRLLDPKAGPLIGVKMNLMTRKTLGGLECDLQGRVQGRDGKTIDGLYAAGEVAGFGGGGMHGYRALEGTFLGGCIFSGRTAGRSIGAEVA